MDLRAGSAFGKYTLNRLLGRGGMGQCQQNAGDAWITCTGGHNARVYLW